MMNSQEELMGAGHGGAGPSVTVTWGLPDEEQQQRFFASTESIENQMMRVSALNSPCIEGQLNIATAFSLASRVRSASCFTLFCLCLVF